jgi:hypothetical protein
MMDGEMDRWIDGSLLRFHSGTRGNRSNGWGIQIHAWDTVDIGMFAPKIELVVMIRKRRSRSYCQALFGATSVNLERCEEFCFFLPQHTEE